MSQKLLKNIFYLSNLIYVITLGYAFYHNFEKGSSNGIMMCYVAILCPLIVIVFFKLMKWKPVYEIYIISTCFCYFASLIGSCLGGYSLAYFDKVVHGCSGLFATLLGVMVFSIIKKSKKAVGKEDYILLLVFMNTFNLAIAVLWEFYEYAVLIFMNNDAINHYSQGVHDSMQDMLSATLGGIIITLFVIHHYRSGKNNFFTNIPEKFYDKNMDKTQSI